MHWFLSVEYDKIRFFLLQGLVGEDELNNSYKPTGGHVNVAMEDDGVVILDTNQNANGKTSDKNIELQPVEDVDDRY